MEPIIKVDNVSMCFNLSKEKHESLKEYFLALVQGRLQYDEFYALKDVSLDIMPGDFYGLVGLNGSGKSTLLKTIAGVYKPSKGKVTVRGSIAPLIELGAGSSSQSVLIYVPFEHETSIVTRSPLISSISIEFIVTLRLFLSTSIPFLASS